jgi:hypothetical protein
MIEIFKTQIDNTSFKFIKFNTLISTIKRLYASIRTIADNLYDELYTLSIPTLARGVTAQMCRSYTIESPSSAPEDVIDESNAKLCCVCMSEPRTVVFNCGHCATCVDCSKKTLFGLHSFDNVFSTIIPFSDQPINQKHACPICRAEITSLTELTIDRDYKCTTEGCMVKATVVSLDCSHPSFCSSCWNSNLRKRKSGDIANIKCYCDTTISKICKPNFV